MSLFGYLLLINFNLPLFEFEILPIKVRVYEGHKQYKGVLQLNKAHHVHQDP